MKGESGVNEINSNYVLSSKVVAMYNSMLNNELVKQGLAYIKADQDKAIFDQKEICAIPAPPFKEAVRGEYYVQRLLALGLRDVRKDQEGNVLGIWQGIGNGPTLLVAAHLDTVFPEGIDTTVKEKDGKLYAPGIADNSRSLALILSIIRAFNESNISTVGSIIFCGTVGEEGLGDLRGVKALFRDNNQIDGFIAIDGSGNADITYLGTGSHRYRITYEGPGGHSFSDFGLPSATHALGRAIAKISDLQVPEKPKTTFTVGTIQGGAAVNVIAGKASMEVDLRSDSPEELLTLEAKLLACVQKAKQEENARWHSDTIKVDITLIGNRPAGSQPKNAVIIQAAWRAMHCIGEIPELCSASSTDANLPMSLHIPAITLGRGGRSGGIHSLNEWFDPTDAYRATQGVFLTILGLVGVDKISLPLLNK